MYPFVCTCLLVIGSLATPAAVHGQERTGVMGDLGTAIGALETKVIGLAKAMPDAVYAWRPSDGVRTTGEALIHVAGDNYFAAAYLGGVVAPETGITGKTYTDVEAYEARRMDRSAIIAALQQSFGLLRKAMADTPDAKLAATTNFFSRPTTVQYAWIRTTTHLHEHLGQLIAYARSNDIVPPWSK